MQEHTQGNPRVPSVVLLNTVHSDLANLYDIQELLAGYLNLPIEVIHESLVSFEIRPFTGQMERDSCCDSLIDIEQDLLRIERDNGWTLQELAEQSRLVLLVDGWEQISHIELVVAFGLIVAAMSGSWPDILSVQYNVKNPSVFQIIRDLPLGELAQGYNKPGRRVISYPYEKR